MPRRILEITSEFPYHIVARTNNKEWFHIPMRDVWSIFNEVLLLVSNKYSFKVHAFVLMSNHYHLMASTSVGHDLPKVMQIFQREVSRRINLQANRKNHLFGDCLLYTSPSPRD